MSGDWLWINVFNHAESSIRIACFSKKTLARPFKTSSMERAFYL